MHTMIIGLKNVIMTKVLFLTLAKYSRRIISFKLRMRGDSFDKDIAYRGNHFFKVIDTPVCH